MIFRQLELVFRDSGRLGCAIGPFVNEDLAEGWEEDIDLVVFGLHNRELSDVIITVPKREIPDDPRLPSEPSQLISGLIENYCNPKRN